MVSLITSVPITTSMREDANRLALLRNSTKNESQNRSTGKHSDVNTHIIGAIGELAFSELTGLPVDWSQKKRGDNGIDFVIKNIGIDVKTRKLESKEPDLAVYDQHPWNVTADFLVLCAVNSNEVIFIGWTTKYRFIFSGKPLQYGKNTRWGVPLSSLYTMTQLSAFLTKCKEIQ